MPDDERRPARTQVYRHAELRRLVDPESVAIIGASPRENSFGDRVRRNLAGFRGRVHLVNARYERIEDMPCHPALAALPEMPDCAVIVVGREAVEDVLGRMRRGGHPQCDRLRIRLYGDGQARPRRAAGAPRRARPAGTASG